MSGHEFLHEIRAFIGHSFTEDDEELVRKFLEYFTQMSNSHRKFMWEHAQQAEPRILAEKVLALLDGKNTFIAICERVISSNTATRQSLLGRFLKVRERDLVWKTSDWIIQEIGLAIGKGLNVILLIEKGVREPGG